MKFAVLGTGMVGKALAGKLASLGHDVMIGTRGEGNADIQQWIAASKPPVKLGTFAQAAAFGEMLIACTSGTTSIDALRTCAPASLEGKILIDVSNPLDFSKGMPPTLTICNTDSLGETLQREFAGLRVVKTLNTCNCAIMIDPGMLPGGHDLFIAGNDAAAKAHVMDLLRTFGWRSFEDLGDIRAARGTEALLLLWLQLFGKYGTPEFNFRIVRREGART